MSKLNPTGFENLSGFWSRKMILRSKIPLGFQNPKGLVQEAAKITDEPIFLMCLSIISSTIGLLQKKRHRSFILRWRFFTYSK